MSYGSIYESSWWGSPKEEGWGGIYYDLAFPTPPITDVYVRSYLNSGSYFVFSQVVQPFNELSSDAFIRTEWDVNWYNYQYGYSYVISYSKNYTFTNENNLYLNSQLNIYQPNAYPQFLTFYDNIDLDPNDPANIINV